MALRTVLAFRVRMLNIVVITSIVLACLAQSDRVTNTFHIRHYHGKCLEYGKARQKLLFRTVCRDHFRWQGGAILTHVPTQKCLYPLATSDGSLIGLTSSCSGRTDTLFQYLAASHSIRHLISGKCIRPEENVADPAGLVLSSGCTEHKTQFWFVPQVLYIIRDHARFCWKASADGFITLQYTYICDRFLQKNNKHLRHYATGKCVIAEDNKLKLTSDCSSSATLFDLKGNNLLHQPEANKCVHPYQHPTVAGSKLGLWGCHDGMDRIKTYFYDDKGILDVNILSETCDEYPPDTDCSIPKGHITVNGYQYSFNTRGINVALFDYRSAILEHRSTFDIFEEATPRDELAAFLNNLPLGKILFMAVKDAVVINSNLATALQRHGVSATFATTNLPKVRCSMASISSTDEYRQTWEEAVNQPNCVGASTLTKKIYIFRDLKGIDDCSEEMGVRTGKLSDSRFTATSVWNNHADHLPSKSRLHMAGYGWCAEENAPLSHYLQVDLGVKRLITGIAIQGQPSSGKHALSKFDIEYSLDGKTWQYYVDDSNATKTFIGVERILLGETKVNWFRRTLARFIRIMPVARDSVHVYTHCIRFELFGCSPKGPIFTESLYDSSSKEITDTNDGQIAFYGISPVSKKIEIGISTAASNTTLAEDIDQQRIYKLKQTTTRNNGTVLKRGGKPTRISSEAVKELKTSAKVEYDLKDVDYYNFDIAVENKIIDSQRDSGLNAWNVYSYETEDETVIFSHPLQIKRKPKDESKLKYEINHTPKTEYNDGDELAFSVSISHWPGMSFANAYKLQLFVYFDPQFLTLDSISNVQIDELTINPTRNETSLGFINIQTDVLWFPTNHFIQFNFKYNLPDVIFKGKNCTGAILIDFAYQTNLGRFHGRFNTTLNKMIEYKCKISQTRSLVPVSGRITIAGFGILYDDVKNDVYICRRIKQYSARNQPSCYIQKHGSTSWQGIPYIVSIVGIDTSKQALYGVNPQGNSYVQINSDLQTFWQLEDSSWTSIQNEPHVRKPKTSSDVTSLPSGVDNAWVFPSSANQIIAATNKGIMRKTDGNWELVLAW